MLKEYTSPPRSKERVEFDDIDHQLIGLLQQDGRAGYAALAEHVDMSASTVAHRVNRLVSSGAVVIVTTVADGLGPRLVHAGIACRTSSAAREVAAELSLLDGCTFIAATSGPFDIAITATVADRGALLTLADRCRLTAGVAQLETFEYLSIVKEDYRRVDVRVVDPATPHAATA